MEIRKSLTCGNEILRTYDDLGDFKDGIACVRENGKWGFINEQGKSKKVCLSEKS